MATTHGSHRSSVRVEPEEFSRRLSEKLGGRITDLEVKFGHVWGRVSKDDLVGVAIALNEEPDLSLNYPTYLSAIDWEADGIEVVLCVFSSQHLATVVLKVKLSPGDTTLPTLTGVYPGVNWHERETAEMFGLTFEGHPNPKNLYLPDDFEGHPLLKSFKLASRTFKPWPGAKDPEEAEAGGR